MTGTDLIHMFEYDEWATNRLLEAASKLTPQDFKKDLGTSFRSLHGTLAHIYGAQRIWLHRWNGSGPSGMISPEEAPTVEDLKKRWQQLYPELRRYIAALTKEQLLSPFAYQDLRGNRWSEPLYQQIQHLVFHSMYHRGQVASLIRQLGQTPPQTGLIAYYRSR